nr:cornifelin homolog B-like [Pogona vitticeps]
MACQPCPVATQPTAVDRYPPSPFRDWKTALFDCCADKHICACGVVPCFLACKVGVQYGECCCVPLLPGALLAMRTGLREQLRIQVPAPLPSRFRRPARGVTVSAKRWRASGCGLAAIQGPPASPAFSPS